MSLLSAIFGIGWHRWLTHIILAGFTLVGCYGAHLYRPHADLTYDLTIGCAYVGLALIVVSLLIGPYKMLFIRRNPVNINLRRDIGIWAGIVGCIHVVCGLQMYMGGRILSYFFELTQRGYRLLLNLFGISNDLGLIATVLLIWLLILSNDWSLKHFKGKRWKFWQRFNYLIAALVFAHTFGYQSIRQREQPFVITALVLGVVTLAAQLAGFFLYRSRRKPDALFKPMNRQPYRENS